MVSRKIQLGHRKLFLHFFIMQVIVIVYIVVIFVVGLIGSYLPFLVLRSGKTPSKFQSAFLKYANCFSGGVLLAAGLAHMVPEQMEDAEELGLEGPTAQIFILIGLIFLLFCEYSGFVTFAMEHLRDKHCPEDVEMVETGKLESKNEILIEEPGVIKDDVEENVERLPSEIVTTMKTACCAYNKQYGNQPTACIVCQPHAEEKDGIIKSCHTHLLYHAVLRFDHEIHHKHVHAEGDHHSAIIGKSLPVIMILVLSIHSILEGLSLGAVTSEASTTSTFIAIVVHKGFAGYAMGAVCRKSTMTALSVLPGFLTFSLMSPIGAVIGALVSNAMNGTTQIWFACIFKGIAAGTFLYVGLIEVIIHELHEENENNLLKLVFIFIGTAAMAGLGYFV